MTGVAEFDSVQRDRLRWISRLGWILFAGWSAALIGWAIIEPDPYAQGWRLVVELAFVGRLVNISDGIASGFSRPYLLLQSGLQDIILLLVLYPPMVAVCEGAGRGRGMIGRSLERLRRTAERHRGSVEGLGALGLWVFVFFPFWSTGALVGGVVGYIVGMRMWVVFLSVFTGHVLSVVLLLAFFDAMKSAFESFNEGIVKYIPWITIGVLLLVALIGRWRSSRATRTSDPRR